MSDDIIKEIENCISRDFEDSITERNVYTEIFNKLLIDEDNFLNLASDSLIESFLGNIFKMYKSEDEIFPKCADLLIKLSNTNRNISLYSDFVGEMMKVEKYRNEATILFQIINNKTQPIKRKEENIGEEPPVKKIKTHGKKRVSFDDTVQTRFFEPAIYNENAPENSLLNTDYQSEAQSKYRSYKINDPIPWRKPCRLENVKIFQKKDTEETKYQEKRENENLRFVNDSIHTKRTPTENRKDRFLTSSFNETKEMPLHNLGVKNIWKKIDFGKLISSFSFDVNEVLNDPTIIENFSKQ